MATQKVTLKSLFPTFVLIAALCLVGAYLYYFTNSDVYWPGFYIMVLFYAAIFYMGTYAASLNKPDNTDDILLAGRNIPVWIGIFTMTAHGSVVDISMGLRKVLIRREWD